jgi:hypothetical protein
MDRAAIEVDPPIFRRYAPPFLTRPLVVRLRSIRASSVKKDFGVGEGVVGDDLAETAPCRPPGR